MTLAVERRTREPEAIPDVWLAFAPVKRAQTDWLVEKATELGAARLIPVMTQRTVAERVKLERLAGHRDRGRRAMRPDGAAGNRRAAAARAVPRSDATPGATLYFADEGGGEPAAAAFKPGPAMILIGPEGGFTDEERAAHPGRAQRHPHLARPAHPARRDRRARRRSRPTWRSPATGVLITP